MIKFSKGRLEKGAAEAHVHVYVLVGDREVCACGAEKPKGGR